MVRQEIEKGSTVYGFTNNEELSFVKISFLNEFLYSMNKNKIKRNYPMYDVYDASVPPVQIGDSEGHRLPKGDQL